MDEVTIKENSIDADQSIAYRNFTPPEYSFTRKFRLIRKVSFEDVEAQKLNLMPGFKFSWWYTGAEVTPESKYKDGEMEKEFVR